MADTVIDKLVKTLAFKSSMTQLMKNLKGIFVTKETGKGLSSNDYTSTEKTKLAGIAEKANNYSLPTASATTIGGVKVGANLSIDDTGVLSGSDQASKDGDGNTISTTYAKSADIASAVSTTDFTATGITSVPTANEGNSSKAIANTEFVAKSISALVNGAPETLNTLNELAEALGNDKNFSTTVSTELGKKLNSTEAEDTYLSKADASTTYETQEDSTSATEAELIAIINETIVDNGGVT